MPWWTHYTCRNGRQHGPVMSMRTVGRRKLDRIDDYYYLSSQAFRNTAQYWVGRPSVDLEEIPAEPLNKWLMLKHFLATDLTSLRHVGCQMLGGINQRCSCSPCPLLQQCRAFSLVNWRSARCLKVYSQQAPYYSKEEEAQGKCPDCWRWHSEKKPKSQGPEQRLQK